MRLAAAVAALFALAPLPAAADVTARYDLGKEKLTVEVDDNGDYRAEVPGKFALMRRGGKEYVVFFKDQACVVERDAFLALTRKLIPADLPKPTGEPSQRTLVSAGGEEKIAGRSGTLWKIRLDRPDANTIEAVMSADRDLAPVGAIFAGVLDAGLQMFVGMIPASDFADRAREVFAKGTPLRLVLMQEVRLVSVSTDAIDATRFALPGPVLDAAAFDQVMSGAMAIPSETQSPPPLP
jgi:hypothetical protein